MMLIEFDQTTMANMTAALEHACNKLPPNKDTHENRKRIAEGKCAFRNPKRLRKPRVQDLGGDYPLGPAHSQ
jgi:hypothetical protein